MPGVATGMILSLRERFLKTFVIILLFYKESLVANHWISTLSFVIYAISLPLLLLQSAELQGEP